MRHECIQVGCRDHYHTGGRGGVTVQGSFCLWGVSVQWGMGLCPGGGSLSRLVGLGPRGGSLSGRSVLWTEWLTHACENITLPKSSFAGGIDFLVIHKVGIYWHFCVALKLNRYSYQSLQFKFKAPWQMSFCIKIDSVGIYVQFIIMRSCTKMSTLLNLCSTGKLTDVSFLFAAFNGCETCTWLVFSLSMERRS